MLLRYISLSLFALLAACFPAALNSDVFFIICTFFAADLCLERKGSRRARKRWMSPLASSEVVENHIRQLKERRHSNEMRERMEEREKERESRERERKGKSMNLSSPFMSMVSFIFLVFAFSCGAYLIRMRERLKFPSCLRLT